MLFLRAFAIPLGLLFWAVGSAAGGLCQGNGDCDFGEPTWGAPTVLGAPIRAFPVPDDPVAQAAYGKLTHLWRTEANGTCLGTLGAWHLTPKYIIAEGRMFEILSIQGAPPRIGISATRVFDLSPATFTLTRLSRSRLDIVGQVNGPVAPFAPSRYNVALRKCRRT
ncbi:hypothetical protein PARPLA_01144 [Rhodobacteraceae bacterium THAF1]|nr:hypothetical protein FIU81_01460 [Palleronia sp. THAF1]VDC20755.1 hypothetical protein PARPLA_01144 [Rhodobacteraceae bacterium THAF1]